MMNAPSDSNIPTTLVPNAINIDMLMWQLFLTSSQYFNEVVSGVSYGANDSVGSRFAGSNLLNITSQNLASNIPAYTQGLQTLIANKNLLIASGTANAITLSTRVIDDTPESGTYAKNAPLPLRFRDGLELDFVAIANNTGAVTISIPNFQGLNGALNIVKQDLTPLIANDIISGYRYTIICDQTNNRFILRTSSQFATTTEVRAGVDNKVLSPLKLQQYLTYITPSLFANGVGWAQYVNGMIHQQGIVTVTSGGTTPFFFAKSFTSSSSYQCFATLMGGIPNQSYTVSTNRISGVQCNINLFATGGASAQYAIYAVGT